MSNFEELKMIDHIIGTIKHDGRHGKIDTKLILPLLEKLKADKQIVVVPKFVSEWYEKMITGTFSAVISSYAFNPEFDSVKWVNENGGMNFLCNMFLYGYTVEKEKLYRVVLLKDERNDEWILFKNSKGHFVDYASNNDGFWQQQFTEREIKANDERYWPFAVLVDGVEDV